MPQVDLLGDLLDLGDSTPSQPTHVVPQSTGDTG